MLTEADDHRHEIGLGGGSAGRGRQPLGLEELLLVIVEFPP